jgi:replicative DNA helicase
MAFTRMIGFIAAQGKGKTQTMVNRLNANKTKSCIAYFSENTIEELEVHYGLTKRENLKVVANATSNITLKEILNTCSKKKSTYIFIDYLQNIVNEKNQFIGKNEVQSVNDINKLLALAYKNDLYF